VRRRLNGRLNHLTRVSLPMYMPPNYVGHNAGKGGPFSESSISNSMEGLMCQLDFVVGFCRVRRGCNLVTQYRVGLHLTGDYLGMRGGNPSMSGQAMSLTDSTGLVGCRPNGRTRLMRVRLPRPSSLCYSTAGHPEQSLQGRWSLTLRPTISDINAR